MSSCHTDTHEEAKAEHHSVCEKTRQLSAELGRLLLTFRAGIGRTATAVARGAQYRSRSFPTAPA
eukprot:6206428-Pleurochrysis_carterae.AAC.1